jgi:putative transposase
MNTPDTAAQLTVVTSQGVSHFVGQVLRHGGRCSRVPYPTELTDNQWELLKPLLSPSCKRGPKHGDDLRHVVDAMLYVTHTGCQWRFLPAEFAPWTRVWSQFRRWSRNGTWTRVLAAVHEQARLVEGRVEPKPSMVVIDTHLARVGSRGGVTFHDRGGPYGRTNGAKRAIAVDRTGLPLAARVVPASTAEQVAAGVLLDDMVAAGQSDCLELVMVDRARLAGRSRARNTRLVATAVEVVREHDPISDRMVAARVCGRLFGRAALTRPGCCVTPAAHNDRAWVRRATTMMTVCWSRTPVTP